MFAIDPARTSLAARRERIVAVFESVNAPVVAVPGEAPQPAQACVCGVRNPNATFSLGIHLLLTVDRRPIVYAHDRPEFPLAEYPAVEAEAREFVESMGFMMENLAFRDQRAAAQEEILARLPAFAAGGGGAEAGPAEGGEDRRRGLLHLLAAF